MLNRDLYNLMSQRWYTNIGPRITTRFTTRVKKIHRHLELSGFLKTAIKSKDGRLTLAQLTQSQVKDMEDDVAALLTEFKLIRDMDIILIYEEVNAYLISKGLDPILDPSPLELIDLPSLSE